MKEFLFQSFEEMGISRDVVIGVTPWLSPEIGRGEEIKQWLTAHTNYSQRPDQVKFVIFDDDHVMSISSTFPSTVKGDLFIRTIMFSEDGDRSKEGLTEELARKAITILSL